MSKKAKRSHTRRVVGLRGRSVSAADASTPDAQATAGAASTGADPQGDDWILSLLGRGTADPVLFRNEDPEEDRKMTKQIELITMEVLDHVRQRSKEDAVSQRLQAERVSVTTLPRATVQAVTLWIAPRHVIAMNRGLMMFMYRVARALSPHIIDRGKDDAPPPPESKAISIIASMLDFMSSCVRAPLVDDWPTGPREIKTAENMTTAGERFVICHEIAHIMCGHLITDASRINQAKSTIADLDRRPRSQEIDADVLGACLALECIRDPRPGAFGIVLFLHTLRLAESVGAILSDGTHLPAMDRLQLLWQALPTRYGANFAAMASWGDQLHELMTRIGGAALSERLLRRDMAQRFLERILRARHVGNRLDDGLLTTVRMHYEAAPGAVVDALVPHLLDETELRRRPADQYRISRRFLAHFIARNVLGYRARLAMGIKGGMGV